MKEIVSVFRNLGYSVEEGPEIETDYYNFEALKFPSEPSCARHPGYDFPSQSGIKSYARPSAAAHAYFSGPDSHHGEAEASRANRLSGKSSP